MNELQNTPNKELVSVDNSYEKVLFRQTVQEFTASLMTAVKSGQMLSTEPLWNVQHCFAPIDDKYGQGLHLYGRSMFVLKNSWLVGKIHKYPCINFVLKGKISVGFDGQGKHLEAPAMFASGAGVQKVGFALEDTVWATVHVTMQGTEDDIEKEYTVETYKELGLIDHVDDLLKIGVAK